jgi:hypothetical protein
MLGSLLGTLSCKDAASLLAVGRRRMLQRRMHVSMQSWEGTVMMHAALIAHLSRILLLLRQHRLLYTFEQP